MKKLVLLSMVISIVSGAAFPNPLSDAFRSKGESEQLGIMIGLIRESGYECSSAYKVRFYGSKQDTDFWIVYCSDGYYVVSFFPGGSTEVLDCKMAQVLGIDCFK